MPNPKFVKNRFAAQLAINEQLCQFEENRQNHKWTEAEDVIRGLYKQIVESEIYKEYMDSEEDSYEADREFWRKAYKQIVANDENAENALEEWSLYWNDDKTIIDTFVLKTIKRFTEPAGASQPLLPAYSEDEDKEFAGKLFQYVISYRKDYDELIKMCNKNWDMERVAVMDLVIMECALAEILNFPSIDVCVSLNEYINIAKVYSTPQSSGYINGILDAIVKKLKKEKKLDPNKLVNFKRK